MAQLYVGCGLTLASEAFKERVENLKDRLRDDWEVMEFLGVVAGTAADVYRVDILENVDGCDAFLGICDEPSIGLGWEMGRAALIQKPVLAVAHADSKVTRMVLGAPDFNQTMEFQRYNDLIQDVPMLVNQILLPQIQAHKAS